jgi:hypothetical protein
MRSKTADCARDCQRSADLGGKRGGNQQASTRTAELRHALQRLDEAAGDLRDAMRLGDNSAEGRLALAAIRRDTSQQLEALLRRIAPGIAESEYYDPGALDRLHEIWLDWLSLDPRQGAATLLGFMGRVRRLVLDAIGVDPVGTGSGKANGHAAESVASMQSDSASNGADGRPARVAPGTNAQRRLFSLDEAAEYLGRSREAMEHLVAQKKVLVVRFDRRVAIDVKDLERLIQENKA